VLTWHSCLLAHFFLVNWLPTGLVSQKPVLLTLPPVITKTTFLDYPFIFPWVPVFSFPCCGYGESSDSFCHLGCELNVQVSFRLFFCPDFLLSPLLSPGRVIWTHARHFLYSLLIGIPLHTPPLPFVCFPGPRAFANYDVPPHRRFPTGLFTLLLQWVRSDIRGVWSTALFPAITLTPPTLGPLSLWGPVRKTVALFTWIALFGLPPPPSFFNGVRLRKCGFPRLSRWSFPTTVILPGHLPFVQTVV